LLVLEQLAPELLFQVEALFTRLQQSVDGVGSQYSHVTDGEARG
jgi:hypothetical protein